MFKKIPFLIGALVFVLLAGTTYAQQGSITGEVSDANTGEPLPGANVYIIETEQGTATDIDGLYTISNLDVGTYTVRVTFVGYQESTENITVDEGENVYNFDLAIEDYMLSDVVVTALGIERRERAIGFAFQEVGGDALVSSQETNLVNALAGKVAGVQINSSSGQPGSASRIIIRGNSSLLGNNQPLFVVDGIPISNAEDDNPDANALFTGGTSNRGLDLDPNNIEDISVLKGASATALYGSRAANGAIIITTKSGQRDQAPTVSYRSSINWADAITDGFQDQYTLGNQGFYYNGLPIDQGGYVEPGAPGTNPQTTVSWGPHKDEVSEQVLEDLGVNAIETFNPRKAFYQTGVTLENSLNLAGGTSRSNYFFSAGMTDQTGIVPETGLDRINMMGKFGSQLGDNINVQTSVNYMRTENQWLAEGNGTQAFLFGLNFAPINFDITESQFEDGTQRMNSSAFNNPFWLTENNGYESDVDRFIANSSVQIDILPWLSVSERIGIDTYGDIRKGMVNIGTRGAPNGRMLDQKITRSEINSDFTIAANRSLTEDFTLNVLLGNNVNSRNFNYELVQGTGLNIPDFFHVSNANVVTADQETERQRLMSVYSEVTLDYQDYVYLTLTGRNDWSSTLPKDNNSYFYPSASLGFVFTDAFDVFDDTYFTFGKVRVSVSQIGNDAPVYSLSTNFTQASPGDGVRGVINYPFNGVNGYLLDDELGNPELKPEISTEYESGLDLRFFEGRATLDLSYYNRTTVDQIFPVPVSSATGFSSVLRNAGEIKNYGYEIALGLTPVQSQDFRWDLDLNFSKNTTEVVELSEGVENIFLGGFTSPQVRIEPAKDGYGVIWGTRYDRNEDGQLLIGEDGLPLVASDLGAIGNVQPDWLGNLRTTFGYKGLSLSALFDRRQGGDVLNFDLFYTTFYGVAEITENRGTTFVYDGVSAETGEPNDIEIDIDQAYYQGHFGNVFENFVEDGSFLKLRELSLGYSLPQSLITRTPFKSLRVQGTGRNLWIDSDFSYLDPEGNLLGGSNAQGFYHMVTPSTKSYTLSINVSF